MQYFIKLLSVICVIAFIHGKNITLLDYGFEPYSINHTLVLTCLVNYSKHEFVSHVEFRKQNPTDGGSTHFCHFNITSKCVPIGTSPDCVSVGLDAVKITVKVNASKEYSGANITAILFGKYRIDSISSNTIKLPEITETSSECRFTSDSGEPINTNGLASNVVYKIGQIIAGIVIALLLVFAAIILWGKIQNRIFFCKKKVTTQVPFFGVAGKRFEVDCAGVTQMEEIASRAKVT